jgi:hypothetical protein
MIPSEKNPAPNPEITPEEELVERASAPTVRDLRERVKDLFTTIEEDPGATSPDDKFPQRPD